MQTSKHTNQTILAITAFVIAAASVTAQLEISRSTVDGGGVVRSTGGSFELSGTIGQPDAGVLTNGGLTLTGGFWFALAPTDCNQDGAVNLLDHESLTQCLTGPSGAAATGSCRCFDADGNGKVDLGDFAVAQAAHSG